MPLFLKPKERVEIIDGNTVVKKKRFPMDDGYVILDKGEKGRGKAGWKVQPLATDYLYYKKLGFLTRKLRIKNGSNEFIHYGQEQAEVPSYSRKDIEKFATANVVKNSGVTTQKMTAPTILYLLSAGSLLMSVLIFLYLTGALRVPTG